MSAAPKILLSAGEPSGDLHGAALARSLRARWPDAQLYGFGGDLMKAEGVKLWAHTDQLAVMGFVEVARHLPFFLNLLQTVREHIEDSPPDLVIPIDYPGFNLRLARYAKRQRVPVLYYIAPQVWAWHRSRMRELAENTDRLAVVLPFEQALFKETGANVSFVGHPLLSRETLSKTREEFCAELGVEPTRPLLAILPGSRNQEVLSHYRLFVAAAARVQQELPDVLPVIAQAPGIPESDLTGAYPVTKSTTDLLKHAHAALTKSGTSTLECALAATPMVIAYRVHPLTYAFAKLVVDVEHIGLVNLIAGERVAPELLQDDATPLALANALLPLIREGPERTTALEKLASVRARLEGPDQRSAADHVTDLAAELLTR
ncbi:MAG TPA: lipid-A-disaccharide synthase [Longimicrobiales bacterium]|nr:lipid-A-disaccharide synthase [Longimicrobiales bacterium]